MNIGRDRPTRFLDSGVAVLRRVFSGLKKLPAKLFGPVVGLVLVTLIAQMYPRGAGAATSFSANFDSSLNANYAAGDATAYNDNSFPGFATPGYGGSGQAIQGSIGKSLKYSTTDNLYAPKSEVEMKLKINQTLNGDTTYKRFSSPSDIYYDSSSSYFYIADTDNHRIIKTKYDGTGWTVLGDTSTSGLRQYGTAEGQFYNPYGLDFDPSTGYIYITDSSNHRIIKTKIDGSGWTSFGYGGSSAGQFSTPQGTFYDSASGNIYVADTNNHRIVKTNIAGSVWQSYGTNGTGVGNFKYPTDVWYDSATEYLYVADSNNYRIVKTKMDGTGWTSLGSQGTGVNQFKIPYHLYYNSSADMIYIADRDNWRIVKTKIDGTGWEVSGYSSGGVPSYGAARGQFSTIRGVTYDSTNDYFYAADTGNNRIIKTKFNNFGWSSFGSYGSGVNQFSGPTGFDYDSVSGYYYIADTYNHRVVKTKIDSTGWTTLGTYGTQSLQFNYPADVSYDASSEYLYVTDTNNNRIVKTKIDGTGWTTYGTSGSGVNNFSYPQTAVYDPASSYLYIADTYNHRIVKTQFGGTGWTALGATLSTLQSRTLQFDLGSTVNINRAKVQAYYYCTYVVEYSTNGTDWSTFYNVPTASAGGLKTRDSGTITAHDARYIRIRQSDSNISQSVSEVQIFNSSGSDISTGKTVTANYALYDNNDPSLITDGVYASEGTDWYSVVYAKILADGYWGRDANTFRYPVRLAYDSSTGYLYITDRFNQRVVKTKIDGTGWTTLGQYYGDDNGNFRHPYGIGINTSNDDIYVAPELSCRIIKTKIDGSSWESITTRDYYGGYVCNQGGNSTVGIMNTVRDVIYDSAANTLRFIDGGLHRIVEQKMDITYWQQMGYYQNAYRSMYYTGGSYYDSQSGYIYIADVSNHRIIKTKINGEGWQTLGKVDDSGAPVYSSAPGGFNQPYSIYYDNATDYIYVADYQNHRIVKTKIDGSGWAQLGVLDANREPAGGTTKNYLYGPLDLDYDSSSGYFYIGSYGANVIVKTKFDSSGWTTYGSTGSGVGQFSALYGIDYDPGGDYIYVADTANNRIVKTKIDGTGWTTLGTLGSSVGQFNSPRDVVYDPSNSLIYVSDYNNNRLVKTQIDSSGWGIYGTSGTCDTGNTNCQNFINSPNHFSYDNSSSTFYVADVGNRAIVKTKWGGEGYQRLAGPAPQTLMRTYGATSSFAVRYLRSENKLAFYPALGLKAVVAKVDLSGLSGTAWQSLKINWTESTGEINVYLNDELKYTNTIGTFQSTGDYFYLASDPTDSNLAFGGYIDNFTITKLSNDTQPPTNPTTYNAWDTSSKANAITSGTWKNYANPYFEWSGATDDSAGVRGYFVYFGTDDTADPKTAGSWQTVFSYTSSATLTSGSTYYLRLKTQDNDFNESTAATGFTYKYDTAAPSVPEYVNISPVGCSTSSNFTITWPVSSDQHSGLNNYSYRLSSSGNIIETAETSLSVAPYQEGDNVFYVRAKDNAGNVSDWQTGVFCSVGVAYIIDGPEVAAGPSSLSVDWASNKKTTSYVQVYDGNIYVSEQGHTDYEITHSVQIVGLKSEKLYRYKLRWIDENGNSGEGGWYESTTAETPQVTNLAVNNLSPTRAIVSWATNYASSAEIEYGVGNYDGKLSIEGSGNSFSKEIVSLTAGSDYQLRIKAITSDGTEFSGGVTFKTDPLPKISNLRFEQIKDRAAPAVKVTWETNVDATSALFYHIKGTPSYSELSATDKKQDHSMEIGDLSDNTTYEVYIKGTDQYGNEAVSDINTFMTDYDTRPPKIENIVIEVSNVGTANEDYSQIVVSWKTDELATSQVEYGQGISSDDYVQKTTEDQTSSNHHLVIISQLEPQVPYHLRAISKDKAGNTAYSKNNIAIPGEVKESVFNIILKFFNKTFGWLKVGV